MTQQTHWPFGQDAGAPSSRAMRRHGSAAAAGMMKVPTFRQRAVRDRLIVGGRAHTRKRGLS
ncbi:MAG: hypothetical protein FDZ70_00915 [Actinobacteria bacterium]|nr:MAG: hypothetical protein FDZ70_00915 [Actinomycetota bacterium]